MSELSEIVQRRVYLGTGIVLTAEDAEALGRAALVSVVDLDSMIRALQSTMDTADVEKLSRDLTAFANGDK